MKDIKGYIERLDKSMTRKEKLFFFNKVKWEKYDAVVDFGGADGHLLYEVDKYLNAHKKDKEKKIQLFNIECNADIKQRYDYSRQYFHAFSLDTWKPELHGKRVLLILSSVLHEVDSATRLAIMDFAAEYADTVVVRDMHFKASRWTRERESKKTKVFVENYQTLLNTDERRLFCDIYRDSPYRSVQSLYQFFLKYTYVENWATEKQENYFSDNILNTTKDLYKSDFRCKYCKHYILPYKKKEVLKHFGYRMRANTHVKLILEQRREKPLTEKQIKRKLKK